MKAALETTRSYSGACLGLLATLRVQWVVLIATSPAKQVREGNTLNPRFMGLRPPTYDEARRLCPLDFDGAGLPASAQPRRARSPWLPKPWGGQGSCASKSRHQRPDISGSFSNRKKNLLGLFQDLPGPPDLPLRFPEPPRARVQLRMLAMPPKEAGSSTCLDRVRLQEGAQAFRKPEAWL